MKYYLAIVQNDTTSALFSYNNLDEALAAFHSELAYHGLDRNKTLCTIFNSGGGRLKVEKWERSSL